MSSSTQPELRDESEIDAEAADRPSDAETS